MPHFVITWIITGISLLLTAHFVPGFKIDGFVAALIAAVLLGLVNAIVRPILIILTLPITILTLGLFLLVVNAISILLVAALTPGFIIVGFLPALIGSIVLAILSTVIHFVINQFVEA
jgi:putative membrane protein